MFITNELNYEMSESDKEILKQIKIILVDKEGFIENIELFYYLNYYFRTYFEDLKELIEKLSIRFFIISDIHKYTNEIFNLNFVKRIKKSVIIFSINDDFINTLFSIEIPVIIFFDEKRENYLHFESFEQRDSFYSNLHQKVLKNTEYFL